MFDWKTNLNSLGIVLTIVGVWILYVNSPINFDGIDGGTADTDFKALGRQVLRRNRLMTLGVYAILAGSALQLASNYVPAGR